jgi:hydroxyacylglutathione hydrolase
MRRVAEDVFQIPLAPRDGVNAYLLGDVVVDAGTSGAGKRLVRALQGHAVGVHAFEVPVWVGERDRADVESGRPLVADSWAKPIVGRLARYEPVDVARSLHEGDAIGPGFVVLETPGHSAGHVSFWREADRTLVCGDVLVNMHLITTARGLREPPAIFTPDPARNRDSARRLAALEPELVLFGHGPPLRDPAALEELVDALPK